MGALSKDEVNLDLFNEVEAQKEEIKMLRETLTEVSECVDSFYEQGSPRKLYPELSRFAGTIHVMDKITRDALK